MKESSLEKRLKFFCEKENILCLKLDAKIYHSIPDRMLIKEQKCVFCELKTITKLKLGQKRMIEILLLRYMTPTIVITHHFDFKLITDFFDSNICQIPKKS